MRRCCDSVQEEAFVLHPLALWYVGRAVAVNYLLSSVFLLLGGWWCCLAALLCIVGLSYSLSQYVLYAQLFDGVFPSAPGCNVAGALEPQGVARQQIVLVGHHDSPFIFAFLERFQRLAFIRFLLAMLAYAWLCAYSFAACMQHLLSLGMRGTLPLWVTIAGLPFALQLFFMMSGEKSPGAGDNLNAAFLITIIARHFLAERDRGRPLKHTRLILLSTDGEEIGQRGAIAYVRSHHLQLHAVPTFVVNIDSVYRHRDLTLLTRDRNFTCRLSEAMVSDLDAVAADLGLSMKRRAIPFGGGGTDAAAFAADGIEAASIVGMPISLASAEHLYHTSKDTVEHIEIEAVAAVLAVVAGYVRMADGRVAAKA